MTQVSLPQLQQAAGAAGSAAGAAAGGNFWTPQNLGQIISGIKDLMMEYQKMKAMLGGSEPTLESSGRAPSDMIPPQRSNGVTMPQLLGFVKSVLTNLEQQGMGDKTILEVLQATPYTVNQIKGMMP